MDTLRSVIVLIPGENVRKKTKGWWVMGDDGSWFWF
jgi:hypothetical protein